MSRLWTGWLHCSDYKKLRIVPGKDRVKNVRGPHSLLLYPTTRGLARVHKPRSVEQNMCAAHFLFTSLGFCRSMDRTRVCGIRNDGSIPSRSTLDKRPIRGVLSCASGASQEFGSRMESIAGVCLEMQGAQRLCSFYLSAFGSADQNNEAVPRANRVTTRCRLAGEKRNRWFHSRSTHKEETPGQMSGGFFFSFPTSLLVQ